MELYRIRESLPKSSIRVLPIDQYNLSELISRHSVFPLMNKVKIRMGTVWNDILPFTDVGNFAISERIKKLLEDAELSGWSCDPIIIEGFNERPYFVFRITSDVAGEIMNIEELNRYETDRVQFDINTWDGSDFFTLKNTAIIACTSRVKDVFIGQKIKGLSFSLL